MVSLALSACGGGGNESGPPDAIQASPAAVAVTGPAGACATGLGPTVYLYGGTPPYKLKNSVPMALALDKSTVGLSGQGFTVTFTNGVCLDGMPVSVEDDMGRIIEVMFTNQMGS
ncbi:hypothetical protein [Ideonella azotifigens]|nr:hypothetical protein [Ideonella azotifigens]